MSRRKKKEQSSEETEVLGLLAEEALDIPKEESEVVEAAPEMEYKEEAPVEEEDCEDCKEKDKKCKDCGEKAPSVRARQASVQSQTAEKYKFIVKEKSAKARKYMPKRVGQQ